MTGKRKRGEGSTTGTAKATADGRSATGGLDEEGEEEPEGEADEGMVEEGGRVDRAAEKKKMAYVIFMGTGLQQNLTAKTGCSSMPSTTTKPSGTICIDASS